MQDNKKTTLYTLYIGSNNETKILELNTIIYQLNKKDINCTIIKSLGLWEGIKETSIKIEILDVEHKYDDAFFLELIQELKKELNQNCILYTTQFITTNLI